MKLEQQVCSLELSKRLRELGAEQESFFKWGNVHIDGQYHWSLYVPPEYNKVPNPSLWVHGISAFTVAELGEMLPIYHYSIHTGFHNKKWRVTSSPIQRGIGAAVCPPVYTQTADTEADARAKCLIYLIENGLIEGYEKIPVSSDSHSGGSCLG